MTTHVFFLIRSLNRGGAERQVVQLARALDKHIFRVTVATFYGGGPLKAELEQAEGIRVVELEKRGRWDFAGFSRRLGSVLLHDRPDVLHGVMGTSNELCLFFGRMLGIPVVWGIRASYLDLRGPDWVPRVAFRVAVALSRLPDLVVYNSEAGREYHRGLGFRPRREVVVSNGIDTDRFVPNPEARAQTRRDWGIDQGSLVIGIVARIDKMKGLDTFVDAAIELHARRPEVYFVVVGSGDAALERDLRQRVDSGGLSDHFRWEPARGDIERVYPAFDVSTSASTGEGFSNTIAEAMACGVPMVVTDVGDSARIVGGTGVVVPASEPRQLADAWAELLQRLDAGQQPQLSVAARDRIVDNFSTHHLGSTMGELLASVARNRKAS